MAWIRMVHEGEATGELKEIYAEMVGRTGAQTVLDSRKAMSLHPGVLRAADALARQVSKGASGLSTFREELIALIVSERLNCEL